MSDEALVKRLGELTCKIHRVKAVVGIKDGAIELSEVCCEDFKKVLMEIIDDDLHQKYMDDLDNLFS